MLTYHVDEPEPCALITELSMDTADRYGDTRPVYMKINGTMTGPGAGRARDAEKIYNRNRGTMVLMRPRACASDYNLVRQRHDREDRGAHTVRGKIVIEGPDSKHEGVRIQIVLAERGVLYPGKGKVVVHRMVARGPMTKSLDGVQYKPEKGVMTLAVRTLARGHPEGTNDAWLTKYEKRTNKSATRLSTRIDPRQVSIVAFVREEHSQQVLQAVQIDASMPKAGGPR